MKNPSLFSFAYTENFNFEKQSFVELQPENFDFQKPWKTASGKLMEREAENLIDQKFLILKNGK